MTEEKTKTVEKKENKKVPEKKTKDLSSPQREASQQSEKARSKSESEIKPKPLPVDKEKTKEIEKQIAESKEPAKTETKKEDAPKTDKKSKKDEKPKVRKYEAIAHGESLHASKKQCMYLCKFIKGKKIDQALGDLELVTKMKKAVPFKGEIPHRKGDMMSGRYPVKVSKLFITILKGLKGNAIVNGMELEETKISIATASWARRPMRSDNRQGKRTNLIIKATDYSNSKKIDSSKNKTETKK